MEQITTLYEAMIEWHCRCSTVFNQEAYVYGWGFPTSVKEQETQRHNINPSHMEDYLQDMMKVPP